MSSLPTFNVGRFSFPDTPEARRVAEMHQSQIQRRAAVHTAISYPPTKRTSFVSPARDDSCRRLFSSPLNDVSNSFDAAEFQADFKEPDCLTAAATEFSALAIQSILSGSSQINQCDSKAAYHGLMSVATVPDEVAKQKKNNSATVSAFISHIAKTEDHIILPLDQIGHILRAVVTDATNAIGIEYKTAAHPIFTSQMIISFLAQMNSKNKIYTQIHRYLMCSDNQERQIFGDYCALGKAALTEINFNIPTSQLPGFRFLAENKYEWIQFATFILDYASFVSASGLQVLYHQSKETLAKLSVAYFASVQEYADAEIQAANLHQIAAKAARRSPLDSVDRGILMLGSLSVDLKIKINKRARKNEVPESCQTNDWVVSELIRFELHDDPVFSWFKQVSHKSGLCKFFVQGNCRRSNCKYSHDIPNQPRIPENANIANSTAPPHSQPNNSSMATMSGARPTEDLTAPGVVDIQCKAMLAPSCEGEFKANPAYWSAIIGPDGEPFTTPKSCSTCRKFKKITSMVTEDNSIITQDNFSTQYDLAGNFSMVAAADELDIADSEQHENDGADDFYFAYDLSMSDAK